MSNIGQETWYLYLCLLYARANDAGNKHDKICVMESQERRE